MDELERLLLGCLYVAPEGLSANRDNLRPVQDWLEEHGRADQAAYVAAVRVGRWTPLGDSLQVENLNHRVTRTDAPPEEVVIWAMTNRLSVKTGLIVHEDSWLGPVDAGDGRYGRSMAFLRWHAVVRVVTGDTGWGLIGRGLGVHPPA